MAVAVVVTVTVFSPFDDGNARGTIVIPGPPDGLDPLDSGAELGPGPKIEGLTVVVEKVVLVLVVLLCEVLASKLKSDGFCEAVTMNGVTDVAEAEPEAELEDMGGPL